MFVWWRRALHRAKGHTGAPINLVGGSYLGMLGIMSAGVAAIGGKEENSESHFVVFSHVGALLSLDAG